jgi:hypothetical protein
MIDIFKLSLSLDIMPNFRVDLDHLIRGKYVMAT